jgi:signal transduction histidine kinase
VFWKMSENRLFCAPGTGIRLPQRVCISLRFEPGRLDVAVEDNGAGFDGSLDRSEQSQHYGLLGMRERAERVGGDFTLTSAPGRGTQVRVTIPIRKP